MSTVETTEATELTAAQVEARVGYENRIDAAQEHWVDACEAAYMISLKPDDGLPLYFPFPTFTDYMRENFEIGRVASGRMKHAGRVMAIIRQAGLTLPTNES